MLTHYSHLRHKHPKEYLDVKPSRSCKRLSTSSDCSSTSSSTSQLSIYDAFDKHRIYSTSSKEHKELTKAVAHCLAKDGTQWRSKDLWQCLSILIHDNYKLPSRHHFSRVAIPDLYATTKKERIQVELQQDMEFFSATTDLWSSATMQPYISYSVHFIDRCWRLKSYCLQTHFIPEDHTGANIKDHLLESLSRWNLALEKQVAITTDNGSNVKLACQLLKWTRLSCFGHILDLAIKKGLQDSRIE